MISSEEMTRTIHEAFALHEKKVSAQQSLVLDVVLGVAGAFADRFSVFILPLLATVGGFWIWNSVLPKPDTFQLIGLGLYGALVEIPILLTTLRKK